MSLLKNSYVGLYLLLTLTAAQATGESPEDDNIIASEKFKPEMVEGQYTNDDGKAIYQWQSTAETSPHPRVGYTQNRGAKVRHIQRTKDKIIYDVIYTFDEYGRRVVPNKNPKGEKFMIFFGCSFTYGNGVNDDETIPYYVYQEKPEYTPYNYGIAASGPHMMLAQTEAFDFSKQVKENEGYILYIYLDAHVTRANGFMDEMGWLKDSPYYEKSKNGEMVYQGSFLEVQPWRTKLLLFLGNKLKLNQIFGRNLPFIRDVHYKYTCNLIHQSKKNMLETFPKAKFRLVTIPNSPMPKALRDCLRKKKITTINIQYEMKDEYFIKYDGHFSPQGNKRFAQSIAKALFSEESSR